MKLPLEWSQPLHLDGRLPPESYSPTRDSCFLVLVLGFGTWRSALILFQFFHPLPIPNPLPFFYPNTFPYYHFVLQWQCMQSFTEVLSPWSSENTKMAHLVMIIVSCGKNFNNYFSCRHHRIILKLFPSQNTKYFLYRNKRKSLLLKVCQPYLQSRFTMLLHHCSEYR